MTNVVNLFAGRSIKGRKLPKPVECKKCGDEIEAARLQVMPGTKLCVSCADASERRTARILAGTRDDDTVIIRRAR